MVDPTGTPSRQQGCACACRRKSCRFRRPGCGACQYPWFGLLVPVLRRCGLGQHVPIDVDSARTVGEAVMKITEVRAHAMSVPYDQPRWTAHERVERDQVVL